MLIRSRALPGTTLVPSLVLLAAFFAGMPVASARAAEMTAADSSRFDTYIAQVERELEQRTSSGAFSVLAKPLPVKGKETAVSPGIDPNPNDIGGAYIHDWAGAAFIPGATGAEVASVLSDYARHKSIYAPEVVDSRLLSRDGNQTRSYLRLRKKKVLTVILDSEYESRFLQPNPQSGYSISRSTSIREVENAGTAEEKALPAGTGNGFLWRLNAYWTWQERDGGVHVECRAISLTRDVPTGLGWMVQPIIRSLPRESLQATLENTRRAVLAGKRAAR